MLFENLFSLQLKLSASDLETPSVAAPLVVVVGASGDIGGAVAYQLHRKGFRLVLTHSPTGKPRDALQGIGFWYEVDVCDADQVSSMAKAVALQHGQVHAVVYCAGITGDAAVARITDEGWRQIIDTNLSGAFYFIRSFASDLMAASGSVVLIGSVAASKGTAGQLGYERLPTLA